MKYCKQCGTPLVPGLRFCRWCGVALEESTAKSHGSFAGSGRLSGWQLIKSNPGILKTIAKAAAKSLALSAVVLIPGMLLLMNGLTALGTVWMFAGSFGMVAWTYRKPWRLGLVSCLIPPVAAGLCYIVQFILFANANVPLTFVLGAVLLGVGVGWLRAATHQIYQENGSFFARRTIGYLAIWAAAFGITQMLGFIAANVWLIRAGLATGAFSTAMLAAASIMVWRKRTAVVQSVTVLLVLLFAISMPGQTWAQSPSDNATARELLADAATRIGQIVVDRNFNLRHGDPRWIVRDGMYRFNAGGPQLSEQSRDVATARYQFVFQGRTFQESVTLTRYPSPVAALPPILWSESHLNLERRAINGANVLLDVVVTGTRLLHFKAIAYTTNENFRVTVRSDMSGTMTQSSAWKNTTNYGREISGWAGVAAGMAGYLAADVHNQLRLDGSVGSRQHQHATPPDTSGHPQSTTDVSQDDNSGNASQKNDSDAHHTHGPDKGALAAAAAAITSILIAAGIAGNIAQSIAAAIAAGIQSGAELTGEQVDAAIAEGLARTSAGNGEGVPQDAGLAPNSPESPPISPPPKPPPIYDKDGTPFATNDDGQYWAPDENGEWRWLNRDEARAAASALAAEEAARKQEITEHEKETQRILEEARRKQQEADEQAREEARQAAEAERERQAADDKRRADLLRAAQHTITEMNPDDRQSELLGEVATLLQNKDTEGANLLWQHIRGERQAQIDSTQRQAQWEASKGKVWRAGEVVNTFTREASKAWLVALTTKGVGEFGVLGSAVRGGAGLASVGTVEGGHITDKHGNLVFDAKGAAKGFAEGSKSGLTAAIGGIATKGSKLVALGKIGATATLDMGETYAKTGDVSKTMTSGAIAVAGGAMNEIYDAKLPEESLVKSVASRSTNIVSGTAKGVLVEGKHIKTAASDAIYSEAASFAGQKGAKHFEPSSGTPSSPAETAAPTRPPAAPSHTPAAEPRTEAPSSPAETAAPTRPPAAPSHTPAAEPRTEAPSSPAETAAPTRPPAAPSHTPAAEPRTEAPSSPAETAAPTRPPAAPSHTPAAEPRTEAPSSPAETAAPTRPPAAPSHTPAAEPRTEAPSSPAETAAPTRPPAAPSHTPAAEPRTEAPSSPAETAAPTRPPAAPSHTPAAEPRTEAPSSPAETAAPTRPPAAPSHTPAAEPRTEAPSSPAETAAPTRPPAAPSHTPAAEPRTEAPSSPAETAAPTRPPAAPSHTPAAEPRTEAPSSPAETAAPTRPPAAPSHTPAAEPRTEAPSSPAETAAPTRPPAAPSHTPAAEPRTEAPSSPAETAAPTRPPAAPSHTPAAEPRTEAPSSPAETAAPTRPLAPPTEDPHNMADGKLPPSQQSPKTHEPPSSTHHSATAQPREAPVGGPPGGEPPGSGGGRVGPPLPPETAQDRAAAAEAAHRDALRKEWQAERMAARARAKADADPDNLAKQIVARGKESELSEAQKNEWDARLKASDAQEEARAGKPPYVETPQDRVAAAEAAHRDAQHKTWEAERAAAEARKQAPASPAETSKQAAAGEADAHVATAKPAAADDAPVGDHPPSPRAAAPQETAPPAPGRPSKSTVDGAPSAKKRTASEEVEDFIRSAESKSVRERKAEGAAAWEKAQQDPDAVKAADASGHDADRAETSTESRSRTTQEAVIVVGARGRVEGPPVFNAPEDQHLGAAGKTTVRIPAGFDAETDDPARIEVRLPKNLDNLGGAARKQRVGQIRELCYGADQKG